MKLLIDISHPAHVHFFRHPLRLLRARGHEVLVTSRAKEVTLDLLRELGLEHIELSAMRQTGIMSLARELLVREVRLRRIVKQYKPDLLTAIGGIFISHVGQLTRTPSVVFYDSPNAWLQNALTYPFASRVVVPRCYTGWLPAKRSMRYDGYHEISYLHPDYFMPNRNKAVSNGLAPEGDTFIVRLVAWAASHDIGERGLNDILVERIVGMLESRGTVLVSSERPLPPRLSAYRYHGNPAETGDSMDLGDVVRKIEARGASVADKFDAALDAENKHRAGLEDKFKQAQEKAKQSDDEAAPDNPLDDRWR